MTLKELSEIEIRNPFTVQSLFNENFFVNFLTVNDKDKLTKDFLIDGESYSLFSVEDGSFIFEKSNEDIFDIVKEIINCLFESKKTVFLSTIGFNSDDNITLSVMENESDRVLMCTYIKTMFDLVFEKYNMKTSYAAFHARQVNDGKVELPHLHIILSSESDNESLEQFLKDFSSNIEDE